MGQAAYEGYVRASGGVSLVSGTTLPAWAQQQPEIQQAWEAAADAVLEAWGGGDPDRSVRF